MIAKSDFVVIDMTKEIFSRRSNVKRHGALEGVEKCLL